MVVWGGFDGSSRLNTGGQYDPAANRWTATSTASVPSGRESSTAAWAGAKMIVWGGYDTGFTNTRGQYDPATDAWLWTGTATTGAPTPRYIHTAVWTGTKMVVWGGYDGAYTRTGGQYDPASNSWTT